MSPVPFATSISRSSIVTLDELAHPTTSSRRSIFAWAEVRRVDVRRREDPVEGRGAVEGAAALLDVRQELVAELRDVARDRDRVRVAERAEAGAVDPLADVEQEVEVGVVPRPASSFLRICVSQRVPTRHGVHLPHDSCS